MDRSQGRKKSDFVAKTSVDAGAYVDYFVNGTNYKIAYSDFLAGLGVTGTIVQTGAPTGTAVLDIDGTVNKIRSIEGGAGILANVSAQNGVEIKHNFSADSTGSPLLLNVTDATPDIASLVAGDGITLASTDNYVTVSSTSLPYAQVYLSTSAITTISATDTPVKVNGTFIVGIESGFTGDTSGKIIYNGTDDIIANVKATVTFKSDTSNNQELAIYIAKNGTVQAGSEVGRIVDSGSGSYGNVGTFFKVSLSENDFVELFVENKTSTDDVDVLNVILSV
jgi:hypothetical protein